MGTGTRRLDLMRGAWATTAEAEAFMRLDEIEFPDELAAAKERGEEWQVMKVGIGWTLGRYLPGKGKLSASDK